MGSGRGRVRATLATAAVLQLLVLLVNPGQAAGCLPAVGALARAGVQVAWLSLPADCTGAALDARQVAVSAALSAGLVALPLLLAHLLVSVCAVVGATALRSLLDALGELRALVTRELPEPVEVVAERPLAAPVPAPRRCVAGAVLTVRPLRGPPLLVG